MKIKKSASANVILITFILVIAIPILTMLVWSFTERWAWPDMLPQTFSLRALREVLHGGGRLAQTIVSSAAISLTVASLSVVIGLMTTRALIFYDIAGKNLIYFFTTLPLMVPVTVFAMGAHVTFIKLGLNNSVPGVIVAHLICSLPYATHLLAGGTEALGKGLEEQARVLGASEFYAFRWITLPLLSPVILSAFSMAYIVSFSQYFLTLLIGGGQVRTFTIIMVPYLQSGQRNIAGMYSTVFLAVTLIVLVTFEKITAKWSKNTDANFYS